MSGLAGGLFGGMVGGSSGVAIGMGGAMGGMLGSVALGIALPALIIGGAYTGARKIFQAQVRRRTRSLDSLLRQIAERVEAEIAERTLEG